MSPIYKTSTLIADSIVGLPDGSRTSIYKQMKKLKLRDESVDMFAVLDMVEYLCAKQMVFLDFDVCDHVCEALPYVMDFEVIHIDSMNAKHANLYPRYTCVLHHPLQGCFETWPGMDPDSFPVDYAVIEFQGLTKDTIGRRYDNDAGGSFAFDTERVGPGAYSIAFLDEDGTPYIALTVEEGEACETNVPLCDAMESWTVAVSESPLNISAVMDGYRLEGDKYISIEGEEERAEFFGNV